MKYFIKICFLIIVAATLSCSNDGNEVNKTIPIIDISQGGFQNCTVVKKGEPFTFTATVTDNVALGSYSFDIHHNFDQHTHSTEAGVTECNLSPKKDAKNPFKLIKTYTIPDSSKTYKIEREFVIPTEYESGDYHFMIKVTNKQGWIAFKGLSFKVVD